MRCSEYCSTFGFQPHGLSLLAFALETEILIHISKFFHTPHERPKYRNLNEERLVNTNQVFPSQTLSHAWMTGLEHLTRHANCSFLSALRQVSKSHLQDTITLFDWVASLFLFCSFAVSLSLSVSLCLSLSLFPPSSFLPIHIHSLKPSHDSLILTLLLKMGLYSSQRTFPQQRV